MARHPRKTWYARSRKGKNSGRQGVAPQGARELDLEMSRQLQENREEQQNEEHERLLAELNQAISERDREIASLNAQLGAVLNSRTFRAARLVRKVIPAGSPQEKLVLGAVRMLRVVRREGIRGLFRKNQQGLAYAAPSIPAFTYRQWIEKNEPDEAALQNQVGAIKKFSYNPLISIITPVYDPPADVLEQAIQSVCKQTYANWELCMVNGNPANQDVQRILERYAAEQPRVRLGHLTENRGISGNSNACLEMARGEFVAFLDHDDTIAPFALFEVVQYLNQHPDCDLLYSDHDILDGSTGERKDPLFKPGWSPEIMLSSNYITHLTVIRREIVGRLGGFDARKDGAQDWDLFLRVVEQTQQVGHIPRVLYHWRESAVSTATNIYAKSYVPDAQFKSITEHLARAGFASPRAFLDRSGYIRVAWENAEQPMVSIIILSRGSSAMLETCVESILAKTAYPNYEILIVNNGPQRPDSFPYYQKICRDPRVRVMHYEGVFNYSAVNNVGVQNTSAPYVLLLNNDTEVINGDWLSEMVMWASRPEVGAVGAKLLLPDGRIQHAGILLGLSGFAGHIFSGRSEGLWSMFGLAEWYRDYLAVTAACIMLRREIYEKMGGLSEKFLLCGNDVEFGIRLNQAGYRVVYNPFVRLYHRESATHKGSIPKEDFFLSFEHYAPVLQSGDPYSNPNLSAWDADPRFRRPDEQAPYDFACSFIDSLKKAG